MTHPPRPLLAGAALWIAVLIILDTTVLVPDSSDDAYLWLRATGLVMGPPAIAFALAAALPWAVARQASWLAALGTLGFSGGLGLLLLTVALVMIPFQSHDDGTVLIATGAGFGLQVATLYLLGVRLRRLARKPD